MATQIANPLPARTAAGPGGERRTAALPQAPVPLAAPNARTMSMDAAGAAPAPPRRPSVATLMTAPAETPTPAVPIGRWFGGPLLAAAVGLLTVWVAGMMSVAPTTTKNRGRLRLSSDPEGAVVVVDGKVLSQVTPTVIDGEIGATLRVGFKMDGYLDKEADVFVGEGERPFRAKLERRDTPSAPAPAVEPPPEPLAPPVPVAAANDRAPRPKRDGPRRVSASPVAAPAAPEAPVVVATGSGTLSVHVRPWAIVYIDGAKIRQTPLDGHSLGAGLHVVELVNDGMKKREKVTLEVRNNGHEEIRRDWEKDQK